MVHSEENLEFYSQHFLTEIQLSQTHARNWFHEISYKWEQIFVFSTLCGTQALSKTKEENKESFEIDF